MTKQEKFTQIYFNEAEPWMEITTHNTALRKRLWAYAEQFPALCRITEIDGPKWTFEINRRRCSLRLTKPYSEARLESLRDAAKEAGIHTLSRNEGQTKKAKEA